jgi:hypothetical protein
VIVRFCGAEDAVFLDRTGHMLQKANDGGVKCCEKAGNWKIRTRKWDDITRRCLAVRFSTRTCVGLLRPEGNRPLDVI